jgi:hypothetical protein
MPDLVNGKYEVQLVALDPTATFENPSVDSVWKLGTMDIWFREGMSVTDFIQKIESTKYYKK